MKNSSVAAFSVLAFCLAFACSSCHKEQTNASVAPVISFKEFKKFGTDSATVTISFTDGDGDIGLDATDMNPPYNVGSKYQYNLYLVYYYQDATGAWVPVVTSKYPPAIDTLEYGYRIPLIPQVGQNKSLTGQIKVRLNYPYTVSGSSPFKYKIVLIDRALHISNQVDTGPLTP
jgi:hypothetical protein